MGRIPAPDAAAGAFVDGHGPDGPGKRVQRIARVCAAHVRADGARESERIVAVIGEVVGVREQRVVGVRREGDRGAAGPAADHLRGKVGAGSRVVARRPGHVPPERVDVLLELAHHQIAPVAPEVRLPGALAIRRQDSPGSAAASTRGRAVYWPYSFS